MVNPGASTTSTANTIASNNTLQLLYILRSANLAITTDQKFTKVFTGNLWDPQFIIANWTGGAYSTSCLGGIFSAASKGGSAIVSTSQSYSNLTGATTQQNLTVQTSTTTFNVTPYFSLSTANSGTLFADIFIFGVCLD